jgi:LemA protein
VAVARNDYNAAVNEYNGYIRKFPQVITAKVTGAQPRKYFQAAPGSTEAPKVDFSKTPTQPPAPSPATKTP